MSDKTKRAAIYARVSTNDQNAQSQLYALREYCRSRGWIIAGEYVDNGISGAVSNRPQLNQLMADAKRRKIDVITVFRFDRFARSTRHLLMALEEFKTLNIAFISISEAIDTTTPLGEALFTIVGAISQLERDIIRERVRAGIANAKSKGKKLGRPFVVDRAHVRQLRSEGLSYSQIGKRLGVSKSIVHKILSQPHSQPSEITRSENSNLAVQPILHD